MEIFYPEIKIKDSTFVAGAFLLKMCRLRKKIKILLFHCLSSFNVCKKRRKQRVPLLSLQRERKAERTSDLQKIQRGRKRPLQRNFSEAQIQPTATCSAQPPAQSFICSNTELEGNTNQDEEKTTIWPPATSSVFMRSSRTVKQNQKVA